MGLAPAETRIFKANKTYMEKKTQSKKIMVLGSTNMDMVVKTDHMPAPGETVLGGTFLMNPGGKGANQAVAVARMGGSIGFITKVGSDIFGRQSTQLFIDEGIDTTHVLLDDRLPSGVALITVDNAGENSIVVASGANGSLMPEDLEAALDAIADAEVLMMQLEIPLETVAFAAKYAAKRGVRVILDPAPATPLPTDILQHIDIITPNQTEASLLCGFPVVDPESAAGAGQALCAQGVKSAVITLGSLGAIIVANGDNFRVEAQRVEALDSTAAGDVFNGALAVALSEGQNLREAVDIACRAAAISVTRMGAQSAIPFRKELAFNGLGEPQQNETKGQTTEPDTF